MGGATIYFGCTKLEMQPDGTWAGGGYIARENATRTAVNILKDGRIVVRELPAAKALSRYESVFIGEDEVDRSTLEARRIHLFDKGGKERGSGRRLDDYISALRCNALGAPEEGLSVQCRDILPEERIIFRKPRVVREVGSPEQWKKDPCVFTISGQGIDMYIGTGDQCRAANVYFALEEAIYAKHRQRICDALSEFIKAKDSDAGGGKACIYTLKTGQQIVRRGAEACARLREVLRLETARDFEVNDNALDQASFIQRNFRHVTDPAEKARLGFEEMEKASRK